MFSIIPLIDATSTKTTVEIDVSVQNFVASLEPLASDPDPVAATVDVFADYVPKTCIDGTGICWDAGAIKMGGALSTLFLLFATVY